MVINIDSFLEKNVENNKPKKLENKENSDEERLDLDFQKDVEDKLLNAKKIYSNNKDILVLEKIYDEIKTFDEDLPQKFIGIENRSGDILKELSGKYSQEFLQHLKKNSNYLKNSIETSLKKIDSLIDSQDFSSMIAIYEESLKNLHIFPKEFIDEKFSLENELKKREVIINKKLYDFKRVKLSHIQKELKKSIVDLKNSLKPYNISEIEHNLNRLSTQLNSVPKLFLTDLTHEKIISLEAIRNAQQFLREEYMKDFERKENTLKKMMERFHTYYLRKDLEKALLMYDEMIFTFKELPEVFLEKKMEIFQRLNATYSSLSDLLIKNSVSMFLDSYNNSKTMTQVKNYLSHAIVNPKNIDKENLVFLRKKLNSLPLSCDPERSELLTELEKIESNIDMKSRSVHEEHLTPDTKEKEKFHTSVYENFNSNSNRKQLETLKQIKEKFDELKTISNREELNNVKNDILKKLKESGLDMQSENKVKLKLKSLLEKRICEINDSKKASSDKKTSTQLIVSKPSHKKAHVNLMSEINEYFKKLKEEKSLSQKSVYYKKILFYVDVLHIDKQKKDLIIKKLNAAMKSN